jgi:Molecular chaperone (small heat shock protein)
MITILSGTWPKVLSRTLSEVQNPALFSTIPLTKGTSSIRYNVLVDESDNSAVYEIALPGYGKSDVEVRYSDNRLTVSSDKSDMDGSEPQGYVLRTFAKRPFSISWSVLDAKVSSAAMSDGVLRVVMSRNVNDPSDLIQVT